jgi:hypothetical protein
MPVAPEPFLSAYLAVLETATVAARNWAGGEVSREQIADLMDAVHNIPRLLNRWEECDEPSLRSALKQYDRKWARSEANVRLTRVLQTAIARTQAIVNHPRNPLDWAPWRCRR